MTKATSVALRQWVAVGVMLAASAGAGWAQPAAQQGERTSGRSLYRAYCASCHGASGRGDGAIAAYLKVPPANLTQIARRHGGAFPADLVSRTIDGRRVVRTHGDSQMPVWGDAFASSMMGTDEPAVAAKIRALVDYLAAIQEKATY